MSTRRYDDKLPRSPRTISNGIAHGCSLSTCGQARLPQLLAAARIEQHRKGDLTVRMVDAAGEPIQGADVQVQMKRHAFGFGSETTERLLSITREEFDALPSCRPAKRTGPQLSQRASGPAMFRWRRIPM